jgi:hypothetical protein
MIFNNNLYFKKDGYVFNFQLSSNNSKTGNVIQQYVFPVDWITLNKSISELDDSPICFDCVYSQSKTKSCYVRKGFSNVGLISKIRSLRKLTIDKIPEFNDKVKSVLLALVENNGIRFGTYGEPILLGEELVEDISKVAKFWTGYTHQYAKYPWSNKYFMASVESEREYKRAKDLNFRAFFVTSSMNTSNEFIHCPASKEMGKKLTCDVCKLCMGNSIKGKSIKILKH